MIASIKKRLIGSQQTPQPQDYEPVYGLPKASLDKWLARNPVLKQQYDEELRSRMSPYN